MSDRAALEQRVAFLVAEAHGWQPRLEAAEAERDEALADWDRADIGWKAAEARITELEAALRDLLPWAGRQTFENDAAWVNARAALAGGDT